MINGFKYRKYFYFIYRWDSTTTPARVEQKAMVMKEYYKFAKSPDWKLKFRCSLMSYPRHLLVDGGGDLNSAKMQSAYSTAPADLVAM